MSNLRTDFLRWLAPTSPLPMLFQPSRAEGVFIFDENERPFFDLISGIAVSSLGHSHPAVVKAVLDQAAKYMHLMVYGEFVQEPQVMLAQLLCNNLPDQLNSVYLVNSGNEAIDGAVKLAKRVTGRPGMVACLNAYHGSGQGALSLMGSDFFKQAYLPLVPGVDFIRFGNLEDISKIESHHAAIVIETIQGESGCLVPPSGYFQALAAHCKKTGTLLISDEIQSGMGRTGTLFAFEQEGFVPDILCIAKAFGFGLPLGAFISSRDLMKSLSVDPPLGHITTFGGNPVCCAASLAGLKILLESDFFRRADVLEKIFKENLQHPLIKEVRGRGLMLCVDLGTQQKNFSMIEICRRKGVLTDWFLFCDSGFRLAPPLILTDEQALQICAILLQALDELAQMYPASQ